MVRIHSGLILVLSAYIGAAVSARAGAADAPLQAGAAAVELVADDSMTIGGGIQPGRADGQEGKLRAVATVLSKPGSPKLAIVACDVLMLNRDLLDTAAAEIERKLGIPQSGVLINATHTHHAPTTVTVHNYVRDEIFARRVQDAIIESVSQAHGQLADAEFAFCLGEESSVGQNSRLLLGDGSIFWIGERSDAVRPTGPFDPQLPVFALRTPGGKPLAVWFNHSTHTIGTRRPGARSPSFYGLAAQELEAEVGGVVGFLEGASGSTHNLSLSADEAATRIKGAVRSALARAEPRAVPRLAAVRRPFEYSVRTFDEAKEEAAVSQYCQRRVGPKAAEEIAAVFRQQRATLASQQGQKRSSWVQVIAIGDVVLVGVPAEFFTVLGQEIKRRSPFRHTYIAELAGDWIGYLPDRKAFELGGYQTWTGLHSFAAPGTGEAMVEAALAAIAGLAGSESRRE